MDTTTTFDSSTTTMPPSGSSSVEVTHEDFTRRIVSFSPSRPKFRSLKKFLSVAGSLPKQRHEEEDNDDHSLALASFAGTVASVDTVKVSNNRPQQQPATKSTSAAVVRKKGWGRKFKSRYNRLRKKTDVIPEDAENDQWLSKSCRPALLETRPFESSAQKRQLDDAIRGRLDGMDVLSLGPARLLKGQLEPKLNRFIATLSPPLTSYQMVRDMVDPLVLEGFIPGGDDRWQVRMQPRPKQPLDTKSVVSITSNSTASTLNESPVTDDEDGGSICDNDSPMSLHQLLESMWGGAAPPPSVPIAPCPSTDSSNDEDDVLQQAAVRSVPIDIDEDTFMVDTARHLQSVHDIASVQLQVL